MRMGVLAAWGIFLWTGAGVLSGCGGDSPAGSALNPTTTVDAAGADAGLDAGPSSDIAPPSLDSGLVDDTGADLLPDALCECAADNDCPAANDSPCRIPRCEACQCTAADRPDGTLCDDGSTCQIDTVCTAGECAGGVQKSCDDQNPCTEDFCTAVDGCSHDPKNSGPCDDQNACTEADHCLAGQCVPGINTCTEDCTNQIDDTGEGLVDCDDPTCVDQPLCKGECDILDVSLGCDVSIPVDLAAGTSLVSAWPCSAASLDGPESVFPMSVADPVHVTVTLSDAPDSARLLHLGGGACTPQACDDAGTEISFDAASATQHLIALDVPAGTSGVAQLDVVCSACVPNCTLKACGNDGCGGSCGSCGPGAKCVSGGQCAEVPANDTCADTTVLNPIELPVVVTGTTVAAKDNYGLYPDNGCPGAGAASMGVGAADVVYAFTPTVSQDYLFAVYAAFNASIYIVTDCGDIAGSCTAAANGPNVATEVLTVGLSKGVTYFVVVDGFGSGPGGAFVLTANTAPCAAACGGKVCGPDTCGGSCGGCSTGFECSTAGQCSEPVFNDTCADASVISAVPFSAPGKTTLAADDYFIYAEVCPGGPAILDAGIDAPDVVYRFVAPTDGKYEAVVTPDAGFDVMLSVEAACPYGITDCVGGSDNGPGAPESVEFVLSAGESVWLVVDGASADQKGSFQLDLHATACSPACSGKSCGPDACGGTCGDCAGDDICTLDGACVGIPENDTCEGAIPIPPAEVATPDGWTYTGSTLGASGDYQLTPEVACQDGPVAATEGGGRDVAFVYTAETSGQVVFSFVDIGTLFNTYLYAVTNCADLAGWCVASPNSPIDGGESLVLDFVAGDSVYVIVDGWSKGSSGTYTLKAVQF